MRITSEQKQRIVEACKNGMTGKAAARRFSVSPSSIVNVLREHGVETRIGRPPSCALDHSAFDVITPESAYWMGFLFADGCLADYGDGAPQVILDIGVKDRAHVRKFRTFLKSSHAILDTVHKTNLPRQTKSEPRSSVAFRVRSKNLVDKLLARGMTKKGVDRAPSPELEDSTDFWRGAVDGDGTVRIHNDPRRDYNYPSIILCGHKPLLAKFQTFLARRAVKTNIIGTSSGIFQIRLMGSGARAVIEALYANATVALTRKHKTAQEILSAFGA